MVQIQPRKLALDNAKHQHQRVRAVSGVDTPGTRRRVLIQFRFEVLQFLACTQSLSASSTPGAGFIDTRVIFCLNYFRYWQVLKSFSASSTRGTGGYSVIFSLRYSRYWQVLSHFKLQVLEVLAGTQSFSA